MTREEAIRLIRWLKCTTNREDDLEAIDMAIKALQFAEHFDLLKEYQSLQEVVRCKDCRYFKKIAERSDSGLCHRDIVASAWKDNGYCSRGKRKGGADMRGKE